MDMNIIQDGLTVMCVGFSVVFMFLIILIIAMHIMGKIVAYLNKIFPVSNAVSAPVKVSSSSDDEIAVAIAAVLMKQN